MDILILATILFMLISTSLIIYQVKWEPFFQNLRTLRSKLADSWEKAKQEVLLEEQEKTAKCPKEKPPLYLRAALPLLYALLFPFFIAIFTVWQGSPFVQKNPLILFFYIFAVLISLVCYIMQKDSQNFCIKFWLCLLISLLLEFSLAFECSLLLNGYYFQSAGKLKYLGSGFFTFFIFFTSALETHHNWLQWRVFAKQIH